MLQRSPAAFPLLPRRLHPRRRTILRLDPNGRALPRRVLNLSITGMFVEGTDLDAHGGALWLPGDGGPLEVRFRTVHQRASGLGLEFEGLDRAARNQVLAYVSHQRESERLRAFEGRLGLDGHANLKPLSQDEWPERVLRPMERTRARLEMYRSPDLPPVVANVSTLDAYNARLTLLLDNSREHADAVPRPFEEVLLVIREGGASYLADTIVERVSDGLATLMLPERLFLPERRSMGREAVEGATIAMPVAGRDVRGKVIQLDANGLAVLVPLPEAALLDGVQRVDGARLLLADDTEQALEPLRIAHRGARPESGMVRFGMQRLQERDEVRASAIAFRTETDGPLSRQWQRVIHVVGAAASRIGLGPEVPRPHVWTMHDAEGEAIVSLLNATWDLSGPAPEGPIHAVILPPPFARRKETTCPVALAIVETFRAAGAHVLVVRFDGIRHVGESHKHPRYEHPDYHMVEWSLGQCVSDLRTVHAKVRERLGDALGRMALVSFSMAAVAARRFLAEGAEGVDYWMAPMGAPDPRDIIANSSGGVDWVGERKRGRHLGINLIQGRLVDCDAGCDDMLRSRIAELEDARRDMSRITQPVTWICGEHDYWVNAHRVRDILGVRAPGPRELLEVPTGHFVRTSDEAMETFRLIATRVARHLLGREVAPRLPATHVMTGASAAERARLEDGSFDARGYWTTYLEGTARNPLGFDLLSLTDEYQELLAAQVTRLELAPDSRVVDLGCGTGNGVEAILLEYAHRCPGLAVEAVDFVGPALDRAREKCEHSSHPGAKVVFQEADLTLPPDMPNLPYADSSFDAVLISLVLPYLDDPARLLREVRRILRPGGRLVVSSLRPDVDMSGPLKRLREKVISGDTELVEGWDRNTLLGAIQDYIHAAARLVDHEVDGRFTFYDRPELETLVRRCGFTVLETVPTFGNPPLSLVTVAVRPGG